MAANDTPARHRHAWPPGFPRWPLRTGHPVRDVTIFTLLACYSWIQASLAPLTMSSLVGVLIPGAVLGAIAYGRPPGRVPAPDKLDITGFSYWLIAIAALFEWEASAFRDNSLPWHPALTTLINPLISPHPIKAAAVMVWLMTGWALVRR